ncbi:MAG: hypothetical protein GY749_14125 [Desulfobacteraceae bacterium]|nr:hypothetical protein [Desulfobacteraceae bacterium]
MKKIWIAAGSLNLITALIHTIVGHFDLILPFVASDIAILQKSILHACWHMVTATLFFSSVILLYIGIKPQKYASAQISVLLGVLYVIFSIVFIVVGICYGLFLFQWILLLPIGILAIYGAKTE